MAAATAQPALILCSFILFSEFCRIRFLLLVYLTRTRLLGEDWGKLLNLNEKKAEKFRDCVYSLSRVGKTRANARRRDGDPSLTGSKPFSMPERRLPGSSGLGGDDD